MTIHCTIPIYIAERESFNRQRLFTLYMLIKTLQVLTIYYPIPIHIPEKRSSCPRGCIGGWGELQLTLCIVVFCAFIICVYYGTAANSCSITIVYAPTNTTKE